MAQSTKMANFCGIAAVCCQKITFAFAKFLFELWLAYINVKKLKRWSD